ncbi:MAG: hypothetical protein ACRD0K_30750 [Egibacteraceae bacterium]
MSLQTPPITHRGWSLAAVHFAQAAASVILGLAAALVLALADAPAPVAVGPAMAGGLAAIACAGRGIRHLLVGSDPEDEE